MRKVCKILNIVVILAFILTACSSSSKSSVKVSVNGKNIVDAKVGVDTSEPEIVTVDVNTTSFPRMEFGTLNGEPISWYIVTDGGDSYILLSEKILGSLQYDHDNQPVEWQNSTLHKYLNEDFVAECFTEDERSRMKTTNDNDDDIVTMLTLDNLNILYGDIYYVEKNFYGDKNYYEANKDIVAKPFNDFIANYMDTFDNNIYARLNNVAVDKRYDFATGCGTYWVLDQDMESAVAFYVTSTGYIGNVGYDETDVGYRPVIRISK